MKNTTIMRVQDGLARQASRQRAKAIVDRDLKPENVDPVTPEQERDRARSRRAQDAKGLSVRVMKGEVLAERERDPEASKRHLPMHRSDCADIERPCPFVSCKHHLFIDVSRAGSIKFNFPDLIRADGTIAFEKMRATCVLDIAAEGGATMERTGRMMNVTRERIRQIEARALRKGKRNGRKLKGDVTP